MKLTRREFIKMGIGAGLAVAGGGFFENIFAQDDKTALVKDPDMVGVMNGTSAEMFEAGIKEYGGMSRFVKKDQVVVVKPNIGWAKTPEFGATTQPDLVARVIEHVYKAGAKKVYVFDNTCNEWRSCYEKSGIEKASKDTNASIMPGNKPESYKKKDIAGAKILKNAEIHELYLDADVIINVPVLKHHGSAQMTAALKNLMGVVLDRRFWHGNGLHECIAEFPLFRKPTLNIVDAYQVMLKNGPRGSSKSDLEMKKMQVIGTDMVAVDTASAKILGFDPAKIAYLPMAEKLGIGSMGIDKMKVSKIKL